MASKKQLPLHDQQWNNKASERRDELKGEVRQVKSTFASRGIPARKIVIR